MKRIRTELFNTLLLLTGMFSAGMGLKGFLLSSNFIDGGVTGVSMLLAKITGVHLAIFIPIANIPFILLGYRHLGRAFALRSVFGIAGLSMVLALVPYPDVTKDAVLTAVFGGFFIGAGIGLAVRGGAVLDGTEIATLLISKRHAVLRAGDVILAFNLVLFLAAMSFLGIEEALYSILTYVAAAKTLDFVLYGIDEFVAVTIVSDEYAAIRARITEELGRGVTIYKGIGGSSGLERNILYCVLTRLEIGRARAIIRMADAGAFMVFHPLTGVEGGTVKRRGIH